MIRKHFAATAALAIAFTLAGCAPVHRVDRATSDKAKVFVPLTDKAVVYIYRNTILGAAISLGIDVDQTTVGSTGPDSFFKLALAPGKHTITSRGENTATLDIDVKAGQRYYVWQDVKIGFFIARTGLHQVSDAEGEKEVRSLKLLRTDVAAFRMPEDNAGDAHTPVPAPAADSIAAVPAAPTAAVAAAATPAPADDATAAPAATAVPATSAATAAEPTLAPAPGGIAALDDRVSKPMFVAAQDIASKHQCERLLHVRSVGGTDARFYSACPGTSTPIEIACHGAACSEAAPKG
ncbi:DUF2846 domain-containing protein [Bacillus sp. NP157]|nr:DUF2846 domain-containing protein [Bacillus sp. NP157]